MAHAECRPCRQRPEQREDGGNGAQPGGAGTCTRHVRSCAVAADASLRPRESVHRTNARSA
jgi:hypothetical protein